MKTAVLALLSVVLGVHGLVAQDTSALVIIDPPAPVLGSAITVTYHTDHADARLNGVGAFNGQALIWRSDEAPIFVEWPMTKKNGAWTGTLRVQDSTWRAGLVRFATPDEKRVDDNQGTYWTFLVHGKNGKPVRGAYLALANTYMSRFPGFRRKKNLEEARTALDRENALYPGQRQSIFQSWEIELAEKRGDKDIKTRISKELARMVNNAPEDRELLQTARTWYRRLRMKDKQKELDAMILKLDPHGETARQIALEKLFTERDPKKRADAAMGFLREYPDADNQQKSSVVSILARAERIEEALKVLSSMPRPAGSLYNTIAWTLIEKKKDLEKGVELAERAIMLLREPSPESKASYYSNHFWNESNRSSLGYALDTYAYGLHQLGRLQEALDAYAEAFALTDGNNPDINRRYVECSLEAGDNERALDVVREALEHGNSNDALLKLGKKAFAALNSSGKGFDAFVAEARAKAVERFRTELMENRINQPAPSFTAVNTAGETIVLEKLKGKVVVLDFWATWCGPCKAAFPYVQKVYEKYRANPNVVILAVNTWESTKGEKRKKAVNAFIKKNKYTFPVIFDESGIVDAYGVEGIPTQFFIDRDGAIQFKEIGFKGPNMAEQMTIMIDMLLSGNEFLSK